MEAIIQGHSLLLIPNVNQSWTRLTNFIKLRPTAYPVRGTLYFTRGQTDRQTDRQTDTADISFELVNVAVLKAKFLLDVT